jgi:hypothetical protein
LVSVKRQDRTCSATKEKEGSLNMRQSVVLVHRKILLVSCLAICLASTANAQYENQPGGVTLYRDLGFSGTSQTFSDDVTDLRGSYVGNDSVTSVRISSGCRARLYADADYRGSYLEVDRDISDLRGSSVGNDSVTSMRVRCEGNEGEWSGAGGAWRGGDSSWGGDSSNHGVTLYRDLNFSGASQSFSGDIPDMRRSFVGNDTATSVRVDRGCRARLYADVDYRGTYVEVDRDVSDLRGSPVGNDSVTSMRVLCVDEGAGWSDGGSWNDGDGGWDGDSATYGVTLYRDLNFSGTSQTFTDDVSDLRGSYVGNDSATSARVSSGCRVRLYAEANFRGTYIEADRDISDLRGSPVGNDRVTSMQVRCEGNKDPWSDGASSQDATIRVTLYEDTNFRGTAYSFDSDVGDLRSAFGANDEASSVRVAPGCAVRLYPDPRFQGTYTETNRDISDLRSSRVGNDSISSFQVRCQ